MGMCKLYATEKAVFTQQFTKGLREIALAGERLRGINRTTASFKSSDSRQGPIQSSATVF
jgi:hypothetical protein